MTDRELIKFGHNLIAKNRTSIEIYNALSYKASSTEQLNRVLEKVVKPDAKKKKRSPERVRVLLSANRIKLKSDYSISSLIRLATMTLAVGGLVLFLSNEEVNQNELFGWMTLIQGGALFALYYFVKYHYKTDLLLIAMIAYFSIWCLELLLDGIPNDLLEVYNHVEVRGINTGMNRRGGGARAIGFMFPYLYVGVKMLLGGFTVISFLNHKKYDELPEDVKIELEDF